MKFTDLSGSVFGSWLVVKRFGSARCGSIYECFCECGTVKNISRSNLVSGKTRSCGCKRGAVISEKKTTHGQSISIGKKATKAYNAWSSMHTRCKNKESKSYSNYGGRGINVCKEWDSFENFLLDMGEPPSKNHSLDRIDTNGNYEKNNCRWADKKTQARNRRIVKLNEKIVDDLRSNKITTREVANQTGCCFSTAFSAKKGVNWK